MSNKWEDVVMGGRASSISKTHLLNRSDLVLSVIADENTCVGFLLAGVGHAWPDGLRNVFVVQRSTTDEELVACFQQYVSRGNVAIVVLTQDVAARLESCLAAYRRTIPVVLTVPSPYETDEDDDRESYDSSQRMPSEVSSRSHRSVAST